MTTPHGLSAAILECMTDVFQCHPEIEQVKLYGSRAKGTYHERSDIDLVVYGHAINRHLIARLLMEFDEKYPLSCRSAALRADQKYGLERSHR